MLRRSDVGRDGDDFLGIGVPNARVDEIVDRGDRLAARERRRLLELRREILDGFARFVPRLLLIAHGDREGRELALLARRVRDAFFHEERSLADREERTADSHERKSCFL